MSKYLALIIEDDADLALIFSEALRAVGFETETIGAGDVAQKRLATVVPEVIVLDLHLPHIDGDELLRQIRADERLKNTKVIIASADPLLADQLGDDADLVLIKPISFSQLRDLSGRLKLTF